MKSVYYNSSNSLHALRKPQYIMKLGNNWCWLIIGNLRYVCLSFCSFIHTMIFCECHDDIQAGLVDFIIRYFLIIIMS